MHAKRLESVQRAPAGPTHQPKQPFSTALVRARLAANAAAVNARNAGHVATAQSLQRARAGHAAEAHRLEEVRTDGPQLSANLPPGVGERLVQALEQPPEPSPAPAQSQPQPAAVAAQPTSGEADPAPTSRVESALKLVERIDMFLRAGRPQLEISVGGAFQAEVLLERTGPREVAVTVRGKNGPPPPDELARVRHEMHRRGLKLSSLAIG